LDLSTNFVEVPISNSMKMCPVGQRWYLQTGRQTDGQTWRI